MTTPDEIRAALARATPGPWDYHVSQHRDDGRVWRLGGDGDDICRLAYPDREADAHLIASAPTWLTELLDQNQLYATRIVGMGRVAQQIIDEHVAPRAQRLEAIHQLAVSIADHFGDDWHHTSGCLNDGAHGCPLCQILPLSREGDQQ